MTPRAPHGPSRTLRQDWAAWSPAERVLIPLGTVVVILVAVAVIWATLPSG